jgi:very-short-patch-repair endonuclease
MLTGPGNTIRTARKLRKNMSLPEVLLWRELRNRMTGAATLLGTRAATNG